jgi:antitoxin component of MazEF toxin-antitoxin module
MSNNNSDFEIRKVQSLVDGASLAIVVPKKYMTKLGIGVGDFMKFRLDKENKRIVMEKGFQ